MREAIPAFRVIQRKTNIALITINSLGGLVTFLYFNVIAPLPEGQASLRTVAWYEIVGPLLLIGYRWVSDSLGTKGAAHELPPGMSA